jgi:hypothetical protein
MGRGAMSEEREPIDAIVVGFDEQDRVLTQPTSSGTADPSSLVGKEVVYLDYNGNPWKGVVREAISWPQVWFMQTSTGGTT